MTESARQAYLKSGFKELGNLTYYQLRMEKIRKLDAIFQEAEASLELDTDHDEIWKLNSDDQRREAGLYQRSKEIFYQHMMAGLKPGQNAFEHARVDQITTQAQKATPAATQYPPILSRHRSHKLDAEIPLDHIGGK